MTSPFRVASGLQTVLWTFAAQQPAVAGSDSVPAASTFSEHLADADDAALKRLFMVFVLLGHPFEGVSFLVFHFRSHKNSLFYGQGVLRAPDERACLQASDIALFFIEQNIIKESGEILTRHYNATFLYDISSYISEQK